MQKHFSQIVITLCLLCLVFLSGAVSNGHRVEAAPKRTYRSDMAVPAGVQALLDQRAAEGWRLVTMSEGNQDGNTVLVLVFDKE
jgi:hypothetical protein